MTLPENPEDDFGPIEHQIRHSNTINMMDFQHTSYAAVVNYEKHLLFQLKNILIENLQKND